MMKPIEAGFGLAAEWSAHERCWMAWPSRDETWGEHLDAARDIVAEIANAIAAFEPVSMIVKPKNVAEVSLLTGRGVSQVSLLHDDCWIRDMGPNFLTAADGRLAGLSWRWNAWGHRYKTFERDAGVAGALLDHLNLTRYDVDLVMEGGAIDGDGQGTLLASEAVLLNPNRNPGKMRAEIEQIFIEMLGARQIIWLGEGLQDDVAGGHVEHLAAFVRPGLVLAAACQDPADPHHRICADNLARLRAARDANGEAFDIVEIELPRPRFDPDGRRLALSYTNFYMPNGAIIMPAFEDGAADSRAFDILARLFPKRQILQIPAVELAYGGGGIHSLCLPQPA